MELVNGCTYAFPVALVQELQAADDADLPEVRVEGVGFGLHLHWPSLDAALYVPGLLAGVFGTRGWMTHLARRAGQATSPAKAAAARANGAKGGRPRKSA